MPGIVLLASLLLQKFDRAVVATIGFHLGLAMQKLAALTGFDEYVEDELMKTLTGTPLRVGFNHLCCYAR